MEEGSIKWLNDLHLLIVFSQFLHEKDMNFHVYKFGFLSGNWKVCSSKIGFSVTGQETEFAGDENLWFSHENSSSASKEVASHFNKNFIK